MITPALPMVARKAKASGMPPKLASTPDGGEHQAAQQQVRAGLQDRDRQRQSEDGAEHGGDHRELQAAQVGPPVGALGDRRRSSRSTRSPGTCRVGGRKASTRAPRWAAAGRPRRRGRTAGRPARPARGRAGPSCEGPARPVRGVGTQPDISAFQRSATTFCAAVCCSSSGTPPRRRPAAAPSAPPRRRCRPSASRQPDRAGQALEPDVLALVAVEELLPEPGRGRVRRELADRLAVEAAEHAVAGHVHLPVDARLLERVGQPALT